MVTMASGDDLVKKFKEFCTLSGSKDDSQMTSKANGKLVADCLEKKYKKYDVKAVCDASIFPAVKEKGKPFMIVNPANVDKYVDKLSQEMAKRDKSGKSADDHKKEIIECIASGGPQVKAVKESKTGNVSGLTDASKYTGSHKERFDEGGKGKGKEGRVEKVDASGYVGNYKGQGTFDKKK